MLDPFEKSLALTTGKIELCRSVNISGKMGSRTIACVSLMILLGLLLSCWKAPVHDHLVVEVPSGYSGPVQVQLGVAGAPPLPRRGDAYVITVPSDGRVSTSTALSDVQPVFRDLPGNHVWGYTSLILRSGDGIPVGGSIEFFVGTNEQYQIEVSRKHKSRVIDGLGENLLASIRTVLRTGA